MISFQGEPGANSHIACSEAFPEMDALPCATFEDAFAAVQEGKAALGMIPIENSIAGRVADIHHLLPTSACNRRRAFPADPFPADAIPRRLAPPRSRTSTATSMRWASAARSSASSGSAAMSPATRRLRPPGVEWKDPTKASLAPGSPGRSTGSRSWPRLSRDEAHNTTRFVVLSRKPKPAPATPAAGDELRLRVRNVPAALYKGSAASPRTAST